MTLPLRAMGAYPAYGGDYQWRPEDWAVNRLVKQLKGEPFKGYADWVMPDGSKRRLTSQNSEVSLQLFARWAVGQLDDDPVVLVPVPCSSCIAFSADCTPARMAQVTHSLKPASTSVGHWLRFRIPMTPSHKGGPRDKRLFVANLEVAAEANAAGQIILIDDVKTTGAHLRACAEVLRAAGCAVIAVLVAATTVWEPAEKPLAMVDEELEPATTFDWENFDWS